MNKNIIIAIYRKLKCSHFAMLLCWFPWNNNKEVYQSHNELRVTITKFEVNALKNTQSIYRCANNWKRIVQTAVCIQGYKQHRLYGSTSRSKQLLLVQNDGNEPLSHKVKRNCLVLENKSYSGLYYTWCLVIFKNDHVKEHVNKM